MNYAGRRCFGAFTRGIITCIFTAAAGRRSSACSKGPPDEPDRHAGPPTVGVFFFMDSSKLTRLVPAVTQDAYSSEVLMVGFMNAQSLAETRRTGFATCFMRTRN